MANNIGLIKDKQENGFLPITHERAVQDSSGVTLEKKLVKVNSETSLVFNDYAERDSIDPTSLYKFTYYINADGKWTTNTNYYHSVISVKPGDIVTATANSTNGGGYCFLKSHDVVAGGTPDFASGYTGRISLAENETQTVVAPIDANYFYFYQGASASSYPWCLASLTKYTAPIVGDAIDLSDYKVWPFKLGDSTKFLSNGSDSYTLVPCSPGDKFRITANNTAVAEYAWFTEYIKADSGSTAPLVEDTLRVRIQAGTTVEVVAPATTAFLYLSISYRDGTNYTPASISHPTTEDARIEDSEDRLEHTVTIDLDSISWNGGRINEDGNWQNTARYRHIVIPCESGETYLMKGTYLSRYAFLKSYSTPVNDEAAPLVDGTTRSDGYSGVDVRLTTPSGTKYLYLYSGDGSISHAATRWYLPKVLERVYDIDSLAATQDIFAKELNDIKLSGDILSLNPEREFQPKFLSATKRYYTSTNTNQPYPLVFLHLSDIHGNWANVERYLQFADKYSDYIDELVNTGDVVLGLYTDGVAGYNAIEGVDDILTIIGNHETREGDDWQAHIGLDAYNMIIAPHVSSWGVTQPTNASTYGYCYYYKDYIAKNIRAIFVDIMGYDSTEDTWLADTLASARTAGYHVVILTHFSGARPPAEDEDAAFTKIACNYTSLYGLGTSASGLNGYNANAYLMNDAVDDFIQAGGHFIGFIQGHYHADFIAKVAKYPDQMIYSIGATKAGEMRDYNHVVGTRFQDEFQIIAIDTVNTIVKLFKVGANIDRYGRSKSSVCINYTTCEVVGEGF